MSEAYAYIDAQHIAVQRTDTGDAILVDNPKDPRWLRVVEWVQAGNKIQPEPDLSAKVEARELVRKTLSTTDWKAMVNAIAVGRERVDDLRTQITAIRDATTLIQVKSALVAALTDEAVLLDGLIDEAEDNLQRWSKLLQTLAMIEPE